MKYALEAETIMQEMSKKSFIWHTKIQPLTFCF